MSSNGLFGFPKNLGIENGLYNLPKITTKLWDFDKLNLLLWLDASDSSTITISTGVSQWNDKSGNSINLLQSTSTNQPTYITGGLNSLNTIRFDGINHFMASGTNFPLTGNPQFSVFILYKKTNTTKGVVYGWGDVGTALKAFGIYDDNTFTQYAYAGAQPFNIKSVLNNTFLTQAYIKKVGQIASTSIAQTNGILDVSTGHSTSIPNISSSPFYIGQWANYAALRFEGEICELVITPISLSTDLTDKIIGRLHHKWGITSNLPNSHRYKNSPPLA
jgi:hypothetical protein